MIRIQKSRILFLDVGPIQKLLQADSEIYPVVSAVLDMAYEKHLQMVVSPMTLYEISHVAYKKEASLLVRQYREFFTHSANLVLREIDAEIAQVAAKFKNRFGIETSESFQLATAFVSGADSVFTLNPQWADYLEAEIITPQNIKLVEV